MFRNCAGTFQQFSLQLFVCFMQVEWPMKLQIAQEVTCGMNYLHTKTPTVIHGDLKVQNVLIGDGYKAKVYINTFMQSEFNAIAFIAFCLGVCIFI